LVEHLIRFHDDGEVRGHLLCSLHT
jgi:hypothetical protein